MFFVDSKRNFASNIYTTTSISADISSSDWYIHSHYRLNPFRLRGYTAYVRQFTQQNTILSCMSKRSFAATPSTSSFGLLGIAHAAQLSENANIANEQRCHENGTNNDGDDEQRTDLTFHCPHRMMLWCGRYTFLLEGDIDVSVCCLETWMKSDFRQQVHDLNLIARNNSTFIDCGCVGIAHFRTIVWKYKIY